ncbi:hypothetical protein HA402_013071 [Bradysia odoriphaga]|nr:hypothetical protein HA402_013071 [Bradysia odoriphaga]
MGKVKNEGRLFYKKTPKSNDAVAFPSNEAVTAFKFKPVESAPITPSATNLPSRQPSQQSNTKKLKLQQRKEDFIKKITVKQTIAKKRKQQKSKIKKQKQQVARVAATAIPNLTSLKNALPTLSDNLPSLNSLFMLKTCAELKTGVPKFDKKLVVAEEDAKPTKLTKAMKTRHKKKVFMKRYDYLQKLMQDAAFKKNPRKVIAEHVRNRRVIEEKFENKKPKKT